MIILCNFLLPNDRVHAIPADIGTTIKPKPVTDSCTDIVVEPIITTVSTECSIEVSVLYFLYLFFDSEFSSLKSATIPLMLLIW